MINHYSEHGYSPEYLQALWDMIVLGVIKYYWEDDKPNAWIEADDGPMLVVIGGPEKPPEEWPAGEKHTIYAMEFDLLKLLTEYTAQYQMIHPPSKAQSEEMREIAAVLRKLSDDVSDLAAGLEEAAQPRARLGNGAEHIEQS